MGHGTGLSLHEEPQEISCYYDRHHQKRLRKKSVLAVEAFISTRVTLAHQLGDGWMLATKDGSFVAQHEHTLVITGGQPLTLTAANNMWE